MSGILGKTGFEVDDETEPLTDAPVHRMMTAEDIPTQMHEMVDTAINDDFLTFLLITSGTEGKEESLGFNFGSGKSTLMNRLGATYIYKHEKKVPNSLLSVESLTSIKDDPNNDFLVEDVNVWENENLADRPMRRVWEKVKLHLIYFPYQMYPIIQRNYVSPVILWDDVNVSCGLAYSNSLLMRKFVDNLKNKRTHVNCVICTASHKNDVAKSMRKLFDFEIIVPRRKVYEIQKIKRKLDWWNPREDKEKYNYQGTQFGFDVPPPYFQKWYLKWRDKYGMSEDSKVESNMREFYKKQREEEENTMPEELETIRRPVRDIRKEEVDAKRKTIMELPEVKKSFKFIRKEKSVSKYVLSRDYPDMKAGLEFLRVEGYVQKISGGNIWMITEKGLNEPL